MKSKTKSNNSKHKKRFFMGFTLIEIMVVIAIVAIMTAIIITVLSKSRDKGEDGKRQEQLSHLRSVIENETNGAGYASEFNNGTQAKQILDQMILGAGYTAVDNGSKYEYQSDSSSYVVIFPNL
jgi:prepilin-type N-terminal cleavage/methylation domain-containing protein